MSCYRAMSGVTFCVNTDEREELPLIQDPLLPDPAAYEYDLLGRSVSVEQALDQVGQTALLLKIFSFVDEHATLIGLLLPLMVPLLHYGAKLVGRIHYYFFFYADLHRILLGPFWRSVFRLPRDLSLHPSYSMYVYCCDLLCISCPEPDEFFHPANYAQFMRIAHLINPLGFNIVDRDVVRQFAEADRAKAEAEAARQAAKDEAEGEGEEGDYEPWEDGTWDENERRESGWASPQGKPANAQ